MKTILSTMWVACLLLTNLSVLHSQISSIYDLRLQSGNIVMPENIQDFNKTASVKKTEEIENRYYRFLQFFEIPSQADHRAIEANGIKLLDYVPNYTYIASIPTRVDEATLLDLGVRSILEIPESYKIGPNLEVSPWGTWAEKRNMIEVHIKYHKDLDQDAIFDYCRADKILILEANGHNNFLTAQVHKDDVFDLAQLPYIAFVDLAPKPGEPEDTPGRSLHRANTIDVDYASGRSYTGNGVSVLTRDDGDVGPHIDFHGRLFNLFNNTFGTHGDGVSGIFAGAGNLNPSYRGMAVGADLYVIDYQSTFLDNTMDLHFENGVLVTNSSFGDGCNSGYTNSAATVDQQVYNNPNLMHVFSAGNSNNNNCGYGAGNQWGNITGGHKQGKNVIATTNLYNDAELVNASSRGPAYDGRIKPDIAANGQNQISTDPNNSYSPFGGTSGASPGIAGIIAMLHEAYRELNDGETAESALLKASILNTANDLGNPGPDFKFGWGHVNALRAAQTIEEDRHMSDLIVQNATNQHVLTIPDNVAYARVMLYWADPEAVPDVAISLINDLDFSVTTPNGNIKLPWFLDPTPDPIQLDLPATTGEDHLNNMEQITLTDPPTGDYTFNVNGTTIPFGEMKYYIVYDYIYQDEITVIYPHGGEGIAPGEAHVIHWDAFGNEGQFTIEYSTDNGLSWNSILTVSGERRHHFWFIPDELSGQCIVRVSRDGASGQNEAAFTIMDIPTNLEVVSACPDYIRVKWDPVDGATGYDIFSLGEKYMDSIGTTSNLYFDIPTSAGNPSADYWYSVRAIGDNGLRSRRTIAKFYNNGLFACDLSTDVGVTAILSPNITFISGCEAFVSDVEVGLFNGGIETLTDIEVGYQVNDNPAFTEVLGITLEPFESYTHIFSEPLNTSDGGQLALKAWANVTDDEFPFNDTSIQEITSTIYTGTGEPLEYAEDFENSVPPIYWSVLNPDEGITWEVRENIIGTNGTPTTTMYINNYYYNASGQEDGLASVHLDLTDTNLDNPVLSFDLSYATYNSTPLFDALRIDIYSDCNEQFEGTVYFKEGDVLATVPPSATFFQPQSASEWRNELVSLVDYVGSSITLHFVNINGFGNCLYLDNINVFQAEAPIADLSVSSEVICQGSVAIFQSTSFGGGLTEEWDFGVGAFPPTASGPGPHFVTYNEAGSINYTLIVSNGDGSDVASGAIEIQPLPIPDFSFATDDQGNVNFTDLSTNGTSYSWDFGDGSGTSIDQNPTYTYTEDGDYTVTFSVSNDCGTEFFTQVVSILINDVKTLDPSILTTLLPNPATGKTTLKIEGLATGELNLQLMDIIGRNLANVNLTNQGDLFQHTFDLSDYASGLYFVKIEAKEGSRILKLVVQ